MIIYDVIQGSPEWKLLRAGTFGGTSFSSLCSGKSTDKYQSVINRVVFERVSGTYVETYKNASMQRGNDLEPFAREKYQDITFNLVKEVGLIQKNEFVTASPDGLIGSKGGLEIKCLEYNNLIKFLTTGKISKDYQYQIQGCLWVSEREWWDYFVYHPDFETQPVRIYRDEKIITAIEMEVVTAIEEVQNRIQLLK